MGDVREWNSTEHFPLRNHTNRAVEDGQLWHVERRHMPKDIQHSKLNSGSSSISSPPTYVISDMQHAQSPDSHIRSCSSSQSASITSPSPRKPMNRNLQSNGVQDSHRVSVITSPEHHPQLNCQINKEKTIHITPRLGVIPSTYVSEDESNRLTSVIDYNPFKNSTAVPYDGGGQKPKSNPSKSPRRCASIPAEDSKPKTIADLYYALPDEFSEIVQAVKNTSVLWFFPNMQTAETKRLLENQPAGSFIVRKNGSELDSYKLSFKSEENGVVQRIILDQTSNGFVIRGVREPQYYPSLLHLVATFCCQISVLPCLLRLPGYRPYKPNSNAGSSTTIENGCSSVDGYEDYTSFRRSGSKRRSGRRNLHSEWQPSSLTPTAMLPRSNSARRSRRNSQYFSSIQALLPQGAACRLLYLGQFSVGAQSAGYAIKVCVDHVLDRGHLNVEPTPIEFRVNENGITMTDLSQRMFSQRHYPTAFLQFIGMDPLKRKWKTGDQQNGVAKEGSIFGFVSCNPILTPESNQCHLLSEYDKSERANVICDFTQRYLNLPDL